MSRECFPRETNRSNETESLILSDDSQRVKLSPDRVQVLLEKHMRRMNETSTSLSESQLLIASEEAPPVELTLSKNTKLIPAVPKNFHLRLPSPSLASEKENICSNQSRSLIKDLNPI